MKLHIDNKSHALLLSGMRVVASAINDFVSTTRKDDAGIIHQYESRNSLMRAFMRASKSREIDVVSTLINSPSRARVMQVHGVTESGLEFTMMLAPVVKDGGNQ